MIKGLRFLLTSSELKDHLTARASYHTSRADTKEAELPQLRETLEKVTKLQPAQLVSNFSKGGRSSYGLDPEDTLTQLENDIRDHRNRALAFAFLSEHLFNDEYDLERSDLVQLEILRA